jgi:hypothetical protein
VTEQVETRVSTPEAERVPLETRRVFTVDETAKVWQSPAGLPGFYVEGAYAGAIVRLRPPTGTERGKVEALRKDLLKMGAAAVRIEMAAVAKVPREKEEVPEDEPIREVVQKMVAEARTEDLPALKQVVERALSRAGL